MNPQNEIKVTESYGVPKPTIQEWVKSPDFVETDFTNVVDHLNKGGLLGSASFVLGVFTMANPSTFLFLFLGFVFSGIVAGCVQKRAKIIFVILFGFGLAIALDLQTPKNALPVVDQVEIQND